MNGTEKHTTRDAVSEEQVFIGIHGQIFHTLLVLPLSEGGKNRFKKVDSPPSAQLSHAHVRFPDSTVHACGCGPNLLLTLSRTKPIAYNLHLDHGSALHQGHD